jgi:hypothetical protein
MATITLFYLGLPSIFVVLATAGESGNGVFAVFVGRPGVYVDFWGPLEIVCVVGIPMLVATMPGRLHSKGRPWREDSPVPAWLAGFAAVLTAVYILILHFDNLGLAKWPLGALSVSAFGVAVVLAPFYRMVASACWKSGIAAVFDPARWWSAWCIAYREIKGVTAREVGPGQAAQADDPVSEPKAAPGGSSVLGVANRGCR